MQNGFLICIYEKIPVLSLAYKSNCIDTPPPPPAKKKTKKTPSTGNNYISRLTLYCSCKGVKEVYV